MARAPCPSTSEVSTDNRVINASAALMDDAFGGAKREIKRKREDKIFYITRERNFRYAKAISVISNKKTFLKPSNYSKRIILKILHSLDR